MEGFPKDIALELVPNDVEELKENITFATKNFPNVTCLNIPDMLSKPLKPWTAAKTLLPLGINVIPHIRTRDYTLAELRDIVAELVPLGLKSVLVLTGDPPKDGRDKYERPVQVLEAVPFLKKEFPGLKVYCGVDPYRQSFRAELEYCEQKLKAGCDGFFSQGFFSVHLMREWIDQFKGFKTEFWVGLSPVTTESFKGYWLKTNKATFPHDFEVTLEYNARTQREMLRVITENGCNAYLMPVTVNTKTYLPALFNKSAQ